jgi:hypothetical protein
VLSSLGVEFDAVNVEGNPAALEALGRMGGLRVPVVVRGDRSVHGWNPKAVAELVGVPYAEPARLSPAALAERLDRILAGAQRAIRQVPRDKLEMKSPDRDRPVRQLGFHIFRLSAAFADALEQDRLPEEWLTEPMPADMGDAEAIARYGEAVRERLRHRPEQADPKLFEQVINTYYGPQTAHQLLERTAWHAAQHLRQLYAFLGWMGIPPRDPLTDADFEGLPLPNALW